MFRSPAGVFTGIRFTGSVMALVTTAVSTFGLTAEPDTAITKLSPEQERALVMPFHHCWQTQVRMSWSLIEMPHWRSTRAASLKANFQACF